jgi:hypothetical protein
MWAFKAFLEYMRAMLSFIYIGARFLLESQSDWTFL